ncbi:acyl-CoA dehydrogenase domain protein [Catenulispora acidiphila DSM 44928]|uniref:Acyl-CoA dehydrogenase domain protein n=1 Tax=Catenulispora acidiphila (strain DSM 44928 / JCM 14897 / NBRC 102108 / NRRL B-24433 / ID139908) TaxID=479433 RepID=C7PXD7_CATAD|nr:acyl-CoA dehydrogenase family protein [Catenulispora acidiphila]ACU69488.1 acyl-CoA dehydrogenase domain protein [Catenulispora acidiphila DSM 44928]
MMFDRELLDTIVNEVVAPAAAEVDTNAAFPREGVDALARAGVLGLTVPKQFGGAGEGLRSAVNVIRTLSSACGSTAMVVAMHYSGTAVLASQERADVLQDIGDGRHLTTLAFSEVGSRSHFWAPLSTAKADGDDVLLDARKSWVTSASQADSYVWSSRPMAADGPMSLWFVPSDTPGLSIPRAFDGMGLRGNDSSPVTADGVRVSQTSLLGDDGKGFDLAMAAALPVFLVLNAAAGIGLMDALLAEAVKHLSATRLDHLNQSLAQQSPARLTLARMRIEADRTRCLLDETLSALEQERPDAQLFLLEVKAATDESAALVADLAMKVCGGAAFRKELGIERRFRDSRAARVMAPTTDVLEDFVGRALCGLPLFDGPAA